jgi:hypothetical protein
MIWRNSGDLSPPSEQLRKILSIFRIGPHLVRSNGKLPALFGNLSALINFMSASFLARVFFRPGA